MVLPVTVVKQADAEGRALVDVLGQTITVPAVLRIPNAKVLWMSVLRALPRPVSSDSNG